MIVYYDRMTRTIGNLRKKCYGTRVSILIAILTVTVLSISIIIYYQESDWIASGTVCMAGIAGIGIIYSSITVSLMKDETRPYVFVDFVIDKNVPTLIDIELSNCGKSSATDIIIEVIAPNIESEMKEKNAILQPISEMSIFKNTVQYLPPSRSIIVMFGSGHLINQYLPFNYTFIIKYKDTYGKQYSDKISIEPMHLMSCSSTDTKNNQLLMEISSKLNSISDDFKELNNSMKILSGTMKLCPICKQNIIGINDDCCFLCQIDD